MMIRDKVTGNPVQPRGKGKPLILIVADVLERALKCTRRKILSIFAVAGAIENVIVNALYIAAVQFTKGIILCLCTLDEFFLVEL